tara:strand:+ start:917 stop:1696 length:780 start_codon:yes stop_codon:yes gene_type:complete
MRLGMVQRVSLQVTLTQQIEAGLNTISELVSHEDADIDAIVPVVVDLHAKLPEESGSPIDSELLEQAIRLAYRAHLGLARESNVAYLEHPLSVGYIVKAMGGPIEAVVAGHVHDAWEENPGGRDDIFNDIYDSLVVDSTELPRYAIYLMSALTAPSNLESPERKAYIAQRIKDEPDPHMQQLLWMLKFADGIHNYSTVGGMGPKHGKTRAERVADKIDELKRALDGYADKIDEANIGPLGAVMFLGEMMHTYGKPALDA